MFTPQDLESNLAGNKTVNLATTGNLEILKTGGKPSTWLPPGKTGETPSARSTAANLSDFYAGIAATSSLQSLGGIL